jgi:signal transduction histidine kinase
VRDHDALHLFRDTAQLIAESVVKVVGFEEATISMLTSPDAFEFIAIAGNDEAREQLVGTRQPVARLSHELEQSEEWGLLRFVPAERAPQELIDNPDPLLVPYTRVLDHPDAWQPLDLLFAPLVDDDGTVLGLLSMDVPTDGMRPDEAKRETLQRYAEQASRAVTSAYQRGRAAEMVELAEAVKDIVRRTSTQKSLTGIFQETEAALVAGFNARGMWVQTFGADEHERQVARIYAADGTELDMPQDLREIAQVAAHHCWRTQQAEVLATHRPRPEMLTEVQHRKVLDYLQLIEVDSILFTPLGLGRSVLGNLVLTRAAGADGDWSQAECAALFGLGEALGQAIVTTRTSEQERELIAELRALDDYRARLVGQLVTGLTDPIGRIDSSILALGSRPDLSTDMLSALSAIQRGTDRMSRVVDDLGVLARIGDPDHPLQATAVDLGPIVDDVVDLVGVTAQKNGVTITVERPPTPVLVHGDADELDRVIANLVSNAVKYTPDGGCVRVCHARRGDEVVLEVVDSGLGISPADQQHLFTEFFRSSNPEALRKPGTGLGLVIVARVVARHGGRIDLESDLGRGSTFRVHLPAAGGAT